MRDREGEERKTTMIKVSNRIGRIFNMKAKM